MSSIRLLALGTAPAVVLAPFQAAATPVDLGIGSPRGTVHVDEDHPELSYARPGAYGTLQRSQFGMTKYLDLLGDRVEISIDTDAWRRLWLARSRP